MVMNIDNVVEMALFRDKNDKPVKHDEFTAFLGEVEFIGTSLPGAEFEVRALRAPNSTRYWIMMDAEYKHQSFRCHNLNRCFPPDTPEQAVRQWVIDSIQREIGPSRVTLV